jgi:transcriptional regulator with XRE-family HTH domain
MNINESPDPRSSMWAWVAFMLRFHRQQQGWSGDAVAKLLNCARSSISRLENDEAKLTPEQADKLDEAWGTGGYFGMAVFYATLGHDPDWFKTFTTYEAKATSIKVYEAQVIPGLLQTPGYARALLVAGQVVDDVVKALATRMDRQKILTKPRPVRLWSLIKQSVLEDPVGGPGVMREQLAHLLEKSEDPNVFVRVVPRSVGAHVGLDGPFMIMATPRSNAAYMEAVGGGRLSVDAAEIERFTVRFDQIGADALSRDATRSLIAQVMETMT